MTNKKYTIDKYTAEVNAENLHEGCSFNPDGDVWKEIVAEFSTKEEALKALTEYHTDIYDFSSIGGTRYDVTEYGVAEYTYDTDEEEWVTDGSLWETSQPNADDFEQGAFSEEGRHLIAGDNVSKYSWTVSDCFDGMDE